MRIWFKLMEDARLVRTETVEDYSGDTRTHKILQAVEKVCYMWDLGSPVWLDMNVREFRERSRTRFMEDNFVEEIGFDYLEIQILEEDW